MSESVNRAFMYGESVFTTMKMLDGSIQDWEAHFERLKKGAEFLYGPFTDGEDWAVLFKVRLETKCQDIDGDKILRLTIFREQDRGLIKSGLVSCMSLKIHLSASVFDKNLVENKMYKLRTCPVSQRPNWWPSYLKAGQYLETILCQKIYMKPQDDDVLFLSSQDTVLESSVANIFIVRHNKLYTPPTGPNVFEGIMRKKVLDVACDFFDSCEETQTSVEQLLKADGVFGSNSIRGLFLVDHIDDHEINYNQEFLYKFEELKNRVFK